MPPRKSITGPKPKTITIVSGSTTYVLPVDGTVERVQVEDWGRVQPVTGQQDATTRYLRNSLLFGGIVNAFGPYAIGGWDTIDGASGRNVGADLRNGYVLVARDCECETRFGERTLPRKVQNPTINPGATGDVDVAGGGSGLHNYNPRAAVYFVGSTNAGVFTWYADDTTPAAIWWNGTAWGDTGDGGGAPVDIATHKGSILLFNAVASASQVRTGTAGAALADMANVPNSALTPLAGSRLLDDGNTLWAFMQQTATFNIYKTANAGGAAWTAVLTSGRGQIRDVGFFFDRDGNSQIVVLTETSLYWLDTTNSVLEELMPLPFAGRALARWGDELLIIMDGFRVLAYKSNGSIRDISPGGTAGMVSGKDFDQDTGSHACVADSASGPYIFYSGDTVSGADRALILQWKGDGWHYIYRWNAAQQGHAARFIFLDPVSGDLIGAINNTSANADLSTGIQFKDIEVNPRVLSTAAEFETAGYAEWALLTIPPTQVPTTAWDIFLNTESLTATETVEPEYGVNGAVSTNVSTMGAQSSNRQTVSLGASGVGVGFSTIRIRETYVGPGGASDHLSPYVINSELAFWKMPTVRWAYSFNVVVKQSIWQMLLRLEVPKPATTIANLKTIQSLTTKVTLHYADERDLSVVPVSPMRAAEIIGELDVRLGEPREGTWRLTLVEP